MFYKNIILLVAFVVALNAIFFLYQTTPQSIAKEPVTSSPRETTAPSELAHKEPEAEVAIPVVEKQSEEKATMKKGAASPKVQKETTVKAGSTTYTSNYFDVPFYSQFADITKVEWRKIGCGIASLTMLIDFYKPGEVTVDALLSEGISDGAYLTNAGWVHKGLALLADKHGLKGTTHDLSASDMNSAFSELKDALLVGPVIASVHYTFDPKNPIPHLVVVSGIKGDTVYFNDPADTAGGGSINADTFKSAWKKRYIAVRPTT